MEEDWRVGKGGVGVGIGEEKAEGEGKVNERAGEVEGNMRENREGRCGWE